MPTIKLNNGEMFEYDIECDIKMARVLIPHTYRVAIGEYLVGKEGAYWEMDEGIKFYGKRIIREAELTTPIYIKLIDYDAERNAVVNKQKELTQILIENSAVTENSD